MVEGVKLNLPSDGEGGEAGWGDMVERVEGLKRTY